MNQLTTLKHSAIAVLMFLSTAIFGQKSVIPCSDGCNPLSISDQQNITAMNENGKVKLYYPNGNLKYKEKTMGKKTYKAYYTENGDKCKTEYVNNRMNIQKTKIYDTRGKKEMVCKGRS